MTQVNMDSSPPIDFMAVSEELAEDVAECIDSGQPIHKPNVAIAADKLRCGDVLGYSVMPTFMPTGTDAGSPQKVDFASIQTCLDEEFDFSNPRSRSAAKGGVVIILRPSFLK